MAWRSVAFERDPGRDPLLHRLVEQCVTAAAIVLGAVHRDVGVRQNRIRSLGAFGGERDADACTHVRVVVTEAERGLEHGDDALCELGYVVDTLDPLAQHDELVATETRDRVGGADGGLDANCSLDEQLVARGVAEGVVHDLEPVQVDEQHSEQAILPADARERLLEPIGEHQAVRQARERIVGCPVLELGLRACPLGDVLDADDGAADRAVRIAQGAESEMAKSVASTAPGLDGNVEVVVGAVDHQHRERTLEVLAVLRDNVLERQCDVVQLGKTEDLEEPVVGVEHVPVPIEMEKPEGYGLGNAPKQLLAGANRFVCRHLVADVECFREHTLLVRITEQVVIRELEPDPRVVRTAVPQARPELDSQTREHVHPALDLAVVIIGMYEVERGVPHDLVGGPSEHLRRRVIYFYDHRDFVLALHRQPRRDLEDRLSRLRAEIAVHDEDADQHTVTLA